MAEVFLTTTTRGQVKRSLTVPIESLDELISDAADAMRSGSVLSLRISFDNERSKTLIEPSLMGFPRYKGEKCERV